MTTPSHRPRTLPPGTAAQLGPVCARFEQAWRAGRRPPLEFFLPQVQPADRPALLRELLAIEWEHRRRLGEQPTVAEYRQRLPEHTVLLDEVCIALGAGASLVAVPQPETVDDRPSPVRTATLPQGRGDAPQPKTVDYRPSPAQESEPSRSSGRAGDLPPQVPGSDVLGVLGRGGMGVVYKARQVRLQRTVALKMILAGAHADRDDLERFRTEAEAIARLQHPGIVQIHEIGEHAGLPFFSMEYCAGGSLGRKLAGTPLPPREAAVLAEQLARAMQAAHEANVIHRDLKPANVLLAADGAPRVTDFGLARKLDEGSQTQTGAVMGTPSYMAPEQAEGKTKEIGPAADVYGLGAILYELLTGRPPFRAATQMDTMLLVINSEPVSPSRLNPKVPRDIETICLKCLEKSPPRRYGSALALAEDLGRYLRGETVQSRPVSRLERGWKWVKRHPAQAGVLGLLLLVVVLGVGGGGSLWLWLQAERAREQAVDAGTKEAAARKQAEGSQRQAESAKQEADDARNKLKVANGQLAMANRQLAQAKRQVDSLHYCMQTNRAHEQLLSDDVLGCRATLEECRPDLRGPEYAYLLNQLASKDLTLRGHTAQVFSLVLSGDGKRLYSGSGQVGKPGEIKLWDLAAGKEVLSLRGHTNPVTSLALSGDGKRLYSGSFDSTIKVWDLDAGKEALTLRGHTNWVSSLVLSVDGKRLYSGSGGAVGQPCDIKVWNLEDGKEALSLRGHTNWVSSLVLSADGKRLYSGSGGMLGQPCDVKVWDLEAGKETLTLCGHTGPVTSLAVSGDGKRLFSSSQDRTIKVWDLEVGKEASTLRGHTGWVRSLAPSGDGKRLFSASDDGTIKVWDLEVGKETLTLRGQAGAVYSLALSADGMRLYSGSADRTIKVWNLEAGKEDNAGKS